MATSKLRQRPSYIERVFNTTQCQLKIQITYLTAEPREYQNFIMNILVYHTDQHIISSRFFLI